MLTCLWCGKIILIHLEYFYRKNNLLVQLRYFVKKKRSLGRVLFALLMALSKWSNFMFFYNYIHFGFYHTIVFLFFEKEENKQESVLSCAPLHNGALFYIHTNWMTVQKLVLPYMLGIKYTSQYNCSHKL